MCLEFPVVLELLAAGSLTLTSVRMLRPHLTPENHEAVFANAANKSKEQIEALIAELAPKPDVPASVRKLPVRMPKAASPLETLVTVPAREIETPAEAASALAPKEGLRPSPRPVVEALAPERYRVQFTVGQETYEKLRRLQTLLRREIPSGDPGVIFDRFLDVLLEKVEKAKLGGRPPRPNYENGIRSGTDKIAVRSRHIPNTVRRAVWFRDRGQCAFVGSTGHRCTERTFLELHHIHPYALQGPSTAGNISLRCRRHNQYEADLVFKPAAERRAAQLP